MAAKKSLEISVEDSKYYFRPYYQAVKRGNSTVYDPFFPESVVIVGCGGNGGYLIPLIARYLSQSKSEAIKEIELILVDGDNVEEKNLVRQNFIPGEMDQNKAEVMANRCNRNLGMNVRAIPEFMTERVLSGLGHNSLIIGCVDRHEVRKLLSHWVEGNQNGFYIDVGNELSSGQMFLSGRLKTKIPDSVPMSGRPRARNAYDGSRVLEQTGSVEPLLVHKFYPEIEKTDIAKAAPSCADLTASGQQMMGVNLTAATLAFKAFESLMTPDEIKYYEITFGQDNFRTYWISDLEEKDGPATGIVKLSRKQ